MALVQLHALEVAGGIRKKREGGGTMKVNLLTLLISLLALTATLLSRRFLLDASSPHGRYYAAAIVVTSGLLAVITTIRMIRMVRNRPTAPQQSDAEGAERPRQFYRIQYDRSARPLFVVQSGPGPDVSDFSCPVENLSEMGLGLACTAPFVIGQAIEGSIIFNTGQTAAVGGIVVRQTATGTFLQLRQPMDASLLMAEQRNQVVTQRADGPRPAVSSTVLDARPAALPSQQIKGVRRARRL
jgi:hypothetical protein